MARWRCCLHALDRTGPPMLALSLVRWLLAERPGDELDVVAFRGGELVDAFADLGPVRVLLDPGEPWDVHDVAPDRADTLRRRLADLPPADATLLVSVAASQGLPYLPPQRRIVTWVVEQGEDLHWIDDPTDVVTRTDAWLAGSPRTRDELLARLPAGSDVAVCPEFVDPPSAPAAAASAHRRAGLDADGLLVVGAGIGTARKGVDLFVEVAAAATRRTDGPVTFAWLGGEHDDLFWRARDEALRLGVDDVRWVGTVSDVDAWIGAADVFLHTARLDSFPLVCIHAALAGTPVVSFAGSGSEEMFGAAFAGAPYPDVEGLLDAVLDLVDPERRRTVAAAQRDAVATNTTAVAAPVLAAHLLGTVA